MLGHFPWSLEKLEDDLTRSRGSAPYWRLLRVECPAQVHRQYDDRLLLPRRLLSRV